MVPMGSDTDADEMLRKRLTRIVSDEQGDLWDGNAPARWELQPTWRCRNLHVGRNFMTGKCGRKECVFCGAALFLTFPEDHSGPLTSQRAELFVLNQPYATPSTDGVSEAIARPRRRRSGQRPGSRARTHDTCVDGRALMAARGWPRAPGLDPTTGRGRRQVA